MNSGFVLESDEFEALGGFRSAVSHSVNVGAEKIVFGGGTRLIIDSGEKNDVY